jgi:hypothetical protein
MQKSDPSSLPEPPNSVPPRCRMPSDPMSTPTSMASCKDGRARSRLDLISKGEKGYSCQFKRPRRELCHHSAAGGCAGPMSTSHRPVTGLIKAWRAPRPEMCVGLRSGFAKGTHFHKGPTNTPSTAQQTLQD